MVVIIQDKHNKLTGRWIIKTKKFPSTGNTAGNRSVKLHFLTVITQEPQELQKYNRACRFIGKFAVIRYHQLLSKAPRINGKSLFDQLATASSSTYAYAFNQPSLQQNY